MEKESRETRGVKEAFGLFIGGTSSVPKNTPGLPTALHNFPSSFRPANSFQSSTAREEVSAILI